MQTFTFTAAAESVASNATAITALGSRSHSSVEKGRTAFFGASVDASSGSATVALYLVQKSGNAGAGRVVAVETATITPTSRRDNLANSSSGDYLATVAFATSGNGSVDLSAGVGGGDFEWRVACTALTTITSLELHLLNIDTVV